jgi:hypothetical protein
VSLSAFTVFVCLLGLLAATVPLGLLVLRGTERLLGTRLPLAPAERVLAAAFAAGVVLYLVGSSGVPIFTPDLVLGLLIIGAGAMGYLWTREGARTLLRGGRWIVSLPGLAVTVGFLLLFAVEVVGTGTAGAPNTYDGSFQSLYLVLILQIHTIPWTLQPYANIGVIYPQGAATWLALPPMLLGWPVLESPVTLPTIFLALSLPAAYCWGERWGGAGTSRGVRVGLLFAAFFGVLGSWPRLFVGGSYDFAFALPLLFLALGWTKPLFERGVPRWNEAAALGLLLGTLSSLSAAAGETFVVVALGFWLAFAPGSRLASLRGWASRLVVVVPIAAAFVARSLIGVVLWWHYPQHVLAPVGSPPYSVQPGLIVGSLSTFVSDVNPFVLFKPKVSPLPVTYALVIGLFVAGLAVSVLAYATRRSPGSAHLPRGIIGPVIVTTASVVLWMALLVGASVPWPGASVFDTVASLYESSFVVFIAYQLIALLPLVVAAEWLAETRGSATPSRTPGWAVDRRPRAWAPGGRGSKPWTGSTVAVAALLLTPLAIGGVSTAVEVPGYLSAHLHEFANVTSGDWDALEWAGTHLPGCSRVFAAPGSAALFLPEYARVAIDFPMEPISVNRSYNLLVVDLTAGTYDASARANLLYLGITVVFATGHNSVSYAPIRTGPLAASSDFALLYENGDAEIFAFLPGESETACAA